MYLLVYRMLLYGTLDQGKHGATNIVAAGPMTPALAGVGFVNFQPIQIGLDDYMIL